MSQNLVLVNGVAEASPKADERVPALVGERLTLEAFNQLAGRLADYQFVKVVVERHEEKIHFINNGLYQFHADYIAENLLHWSAERLDREIDSFNKSVYFDPNRNYLLGIISLHEREGRRFFALETVEVDTMDVAMAKNFYHLIRANIDPKIPLFFKPANHGQESYVAGTDPVELPRIFSHELFSSASFVALNVGETQGRLRPFSSQEEYQENRASLEWFDIIVMDRVPDDIPRIAGIINAQHTTPLSHTNVLATGWHIPNCIQLNIFQKIAENNLADKWVSYSVKSDQAESLLQEIEKPGLLNSQPAWKIQKIELEEPEVQNSPIVELSHLRMNDRHKYGTKAANLGELSHVLNRGSQRLTAFYRIPRPPRPNLLPYLADLLKENNTTRISEAAHEFLKNKIHIPRGIAIPFSVQQQFLESSPRIQQAIGKLKMALELNAKQTDALCISLQKLIRTTRMPDRIREYIDNEISNHLGGVSTFVVRSSSNAEDLNGFSAAGIYESVNHVTTADNIFESIKNVWASLVSARSVRLRQEVGIGLDESYMGIIVQEEIKSKMGGVLVTANPMAKGDFRNVYLNVSLNAVTQVVQGVGQPYQYLYNTVEGGGRTLSIGNAKQDLNSDLKNVMQDLALAGRLLQSHFSQDYTFSTPADIEWLCGEDGIYILQLRPYAR